MRNQLRRHRLLGHQRTSLILSFKGLNERTLRQRLGGNQRMPLQPPRDAPTEVPCLRASCRRLPLVKANWPRVPVRGARRRAISPSSYSGFKGNHERRREFLRRWFACLAQSR